MALSKDEVSLGDGGWQGLQNIPSVTFICGFCGDKVASKEGYFATHSPSGGQQIAFIRICPGCNGPTVFTRSGTRSPGTAPGNPVWNVPEDLSRLYNEARASTAAGAFTAAVLVCRKMLMNIAVVEGANEGKPFIKYIEYLADNGYVPPKGRVWVDYIRTRGNEATHEIEMMDESDAVALVTFVEMLLRFIYEFPQRVPAKIPVTAA